MTKEKFKKVSFDCPINVLERLDKLAEKAELPRSKLVANLVEVGVDTMEECQKVGLLQLSLLLRDLKENMKGWAENMKKKKDLNGFM